MIAELPYPETAIAEMLAAAGIKRIICVDDAFAAGADDLVELLAGFTGQQRSVLVDRPVAEMEQEDLWQQRVREAWDATGDDERAALVDNAYAINGDLRPVPLGPIQVFSRLAPDVKREALTLAQWRESQGRVVTELSQTPTLILFDQDFRQEGGMADDGQKLIAELEVALTSHAAEVPDAFYGLLTNTVEIDDEHARRQEMIEAGAVNPARFVLISKQNLQDDRTRFAARLRTTLLAPIFAQLMDEVSRTVSEVRDNAVKRALRIAPEDLEHIVVRSSAREGVWPADTLLRILEGMQRVKVRESLRSEERVVLLTQKLRSLADVEPKPEAEQGAEAPTPEAVEISHEEIYETAEHVNGLHLPVELGDLFERGETGKRWVVVAQPCDLMVREGGGRTPEISYVMLAEVGEGEPEDRNLFASFELPYYYPSSGASGFVKLGRPATVGAIVLDACVLNADGRARLDLAADEPRGLIPPWRLRRAELHKTGGALLEKVRKLQGDVAADTRKALAGQVKRDPFPVIEVDTNANVIAWDCSRVGRVCDPYARALLSRFTQFLARDAYLHDLAKR